MLEDGVDICVIEDSAAERALLVRRLRRWGYTVVQAETGSEGLRIVYRDRPRVLISDVVLPDLNGVQLCRQIRADPTLDGTYIILTTAHDRPERKRRALNAGADDYMCKPYDLEELRARIRNGLRFSRLQERLRHAALTDPLTGLWNHSQFRTLLDREFLRTRRYGGTVALLMIDLDHFKAVNDTLGHEVGNQVLKRVAQHVKRAVRQTDIVARYGGEEFVVICPETAIDEAAQLAERLRRSLPEQVRLSEQPDLPIRASLGVASTEDPRVNSAADLVNLCDRALYHSKRCGRDRVTRSDQMTEDGWQPALGEDLVDRLRKEVVALSMRSKELCLQSVWALIQALEARDGYSAWHSRNVTLYTNWLVSAAGWPRPLRVVTANAAMLHDLGKIGVPDRLLFKREDLTPEEAAILREVPLITCRILEPLRVFETEILIIRHLRERYDGSGYPDGLKGNSIPIGSRLVAVAEAFDSITCNRAQRPGCTLDEAREILRRQSGRQFDPEFVRLLEHNLDTHRARWQRQVDRARIEQPRPALCELEN